MLCRCFSVQLLSPFRLRTLFLAFTSAAMLLSLSSAAEAAMWVRIWTDSNNPVAGVPELVSVQLVDTQGTQCLDDPDARVKPHRTAFTGASGSPVLDMMELHVSGPKEADPASLYVERSARDPSIWEGLFVFSEPGQWSLQMAYPSWSGIAGVPGPPRWSTDTCTGAEQLITVLPQINAVPDQCTSSSIWCHPRTPV